ncbi:hypothetical protein SOJ74_16945 [Pseudomonas aeruginosa]|uniref:hypothetical protein n=1 Tax=Pseudomonas aeruginosa TaxID=287 RepID=UPI002A6A5EF7|nr:hypothetical protein [Pseudomonas aeruginosa]MDY1064968.1 hypothetical protein [Pseudomonas aeruginosa]
MSNDVCGYIKYDGVYPESDLLEYLSKSELGVFRVPKEHLYNYPEEFLPSEKDFIFLIGDAPGYPNSTYLIDYEEYDPDECDIGFSPCPKERVRILLGILTDLSLLLRAKKLVFSVTEDSQISHVKRISIDDLDCAVISDFEKYKSPPDTLYEVVLRGDKV